MCQKRCESGCRSVQISQNWIQSCDVFVLQVIVCVIEGNKFWCEMTINLAETSRVRGCCSFFLFQPIDRDTSSRNHLFEICKNLCSGSNLPKVNWFNFKKKIAGAVVACTWRCFAGLRRQCSGARFTVTKRSAASPSQGSSRQHVRLCFASHEPRAVQDSSPARWRGATRLMSDQPSLSPNLRPRKLHARLWRRC